MKFPALIISLLSSTLIVAQSSSSVETFNVKHRDWFNEDYGSKKIYGTSTQKAYKTILKDKKAKKVIVVAIIDSGVDIEHEDLKENIWVNKNEIPNNNIDDDKNGYIDDMHGWNFLGNSKGENINEENYEFLRIYRDYKKLEKEQDELFKNIETKYLAKLKSTTQNLNTYTTLEQNISEAQKIIKEDTGRELTDQSGLSAIPVTTERVAAAKKYLSKIFSVGLTIKEVKEAQEHFQDQIDYGLNIDFNPRALIGDNLNDINDNNYGNNDVAGTVCTHGTGVAGCVAAVRDNNIGIKGIASDVKIMVLRAVPMGDEYDKDIALSIRYAVDNGANIINMSFGKGFSPNKQLVANAISYAEKKGVLLIHAAGNDASNIDTEPNFPNGLNSNNKMASNWMSIGASSFNIKKKQVSSFSNYGIKSVTLFSPGDNIITLDKDNQYTHTQGTSFAAPIATGVAALILSYYPDLTPQELISILVDSSTKIKKKVLRPTKTGKSKKVRFTTLSSSGGIINTYNALLLAEERSK
jgi:subtilisin family serine protease